MGRIYYGWVEKPLQFLDIFSIRRDVRQCFQRKFFGERPGVMIGPVDFANVVLVRTARVVFIIGRHDAASDDQTRSFFRKDNVAGLQLVGELPCSESGVRV